MNGFVISPHDIPAIERLLQRLTVNGRQVCMEQSSLIELTKNTGDTARSVNILNMIFGGVGCNLAELRHAAGEAIDVWLPLPVAAWQDTYQTLHLWTQIIGKIRLVLAPKVNHWWHSTLYVTPCGLTTSTIPDGTRNFQITFDFLQHQLLIETSDGMTKAIALAPLSVADFYQAVMSILNDLGIEVQIWTMPQEIADPIPFEQDDQHATYDPESAQRFWQILMQADRLLTVFRARYAGKCSPVHFFWGSFDLQ